MGVMHNTSEALKLVDVKKNARLMLIDFDRHPRVVVWLLGGSHILFLSRANTETNHEIK